MPANKKKRKAELKELLAVMERLKGPEGCPWDREQTLGSLAPFVIEEAYEVVSAIDSGSMDELRDELGDLLFQVVFASHLAGEEGAFDIFEVIGASADKMIRRHPHVFEGAVAKDSKEVLSHWAAIKEQEKKQKGTGGKKEGLLADVPEGFPALLRADKISRRAAKAGFDWTNLDEVLAKVAEEIEEFRAALKTKDTAATEEELGDVLFAMVNVARFVEVNPEEALRKTIGKFIYRFHHIEKRLLEDGVELKDASMAEMESLWNEAKRR